MRLRFWVGLAAVVLIAAGSVAAALLVRSGDNSDFHRLQREEADRAASQAEALAKLSVGQLSSAASFFQAEGSLNQHEFKVVARSLLAQDLLTSTAFIEKVPDSRRAAYERSNGLEIVERGPGEQLRRASRRPLYFPLTYVVAKRDLSRARGYDIGSLRDPTTSLADARDSGNPTATSVVPEELGRVGLVVYDPVYRDGAPTGTVAERRRALLGFVAGAFKVGDLARAAVSAVPNAVDVQLRVGPAAIIGPPGELDDAARAPIHIADRTWYLIVRDPSRPPLGLPLLLGIVGLALAALLGALIFIWSRNERIVELQREASEDPLTGLKNRRRFEEDMRLAMARAHRERTTGALVMLDLDYFKRVNDTHGHPAGDRLIVEVAEVLRRRTRASDVLARLGGDEFAVILPRCTIAEARTAAEAIAAAIRDHPPEQEIEPITASVGVAMFGDRPRTSIASVVSEADSAMYAAKDGGRDGVRLFDREAIRDDSPGGP